MQDKGEITATLNVSYIIQFNSIQFFIINVPSQQQNANYRNSTV
jgi:hypothetical protein